MNTPSKMFVKKMSEINYKQYEKVNVHTWKMTHQSQCIALRTQSSNHIQLTITFSRMRPLAHFDVPYVFGSGWVWFNVGLVIALNELSFEIVSF